MTTMTGVYWGKHDAMVAECSAWSPREIGIKPRACKYLVMPYGDAQWDTEWYASRSEAVKAAQYIADQHKVSVYRVH